MKNIKELEADVLDCECAEVSHTHIDIALEVLKDVLGLIDEELPNLPSIEIILNRLKKKING